jgi:hypothetical protein
VNPTVSKQLIEIALLLGGPDPRFAKRINSRFRVDEDPAAGSA